MDVMDMKAENVKNFAAAYNEDKNVVDLAVQLIVTEAWRYFPLTLTDGSIDRVNRELYGDVTGILAESTSKIIRACIDGTLHERVISNAVCRELKRQDEKTHTSDHLAVYCNAVVDDHGRHPTINDAINILRFMRRYYRGDNQEHINRVNGATNRRGWKHDPPFSHTRYIGNYHQKETLKTFLDKAKERFDRLILEGADAHMRIPYGFHEIGYSKRVPHRIEDHRKHQSSNQIMKLSGAAACLGRPGVYSMRGIFVHRMRSANLASMAEIYSSILFHARVFDGAGFTHQWPCVKVDSAENSALVYVTQMPLRQRARQYNMTILGGTHQARPQDALPGSEHPLVALGNVTKELDNLQNEMEGIIEEIDELLARCQQFGAVDDEAGVFSK